MTTRFPTDPQDPTRIDLEALAKLNSEVLAQIKALEDALRKELGDDYFPNVK
jgi:hypothetical protein